MPEKTSVTFETAAIADSLKRAEACAPRMAAADHAFGTASGIMLEIDPSQKEPIHLRSTNLEVFYDEWVDHLEMSGPKTRWRIPVSRFTGVIAALPVGSGRTVTLSHDSGMLSLSSDKTRGQVKLIAPEGYPDWKPYSDQDSTVVNSLGQSISQVSWACDKQLDPYTGILFTEHYVLATNRKQAALAKVDIPMLQGKSVTVPAGAIGKIIRHSGDVRVGLAGPYFTITPDAHSQTRCVLFDQPMPTPRFIEKTYSGSLFLDRDYMTETVKRMTNICRGSKDTPVVKMLIANENIVLRVEGLESGEWVEEVIEVPGQAEHRDPVMLRFVSEVFGQAVNKAPDEKILLSYDKEASAKNEIVRIDGGGGYMTWFVQWKGLGNG